jgi:TRAP transporter TAXI family solute receptor
LALRSITALLLVASCSQVPAAEPLRLCTARPTGTYALVAQDIRAAAAQTGLAVVPVESEGSMDNLSRLARGECQAAIIQADAYLLYQRVAEGSRLEIASPVHLYDEVAHLVCRDDVGADRLEDLAAAAPPVRVAVGEPGSGSALTWGSFAVIEQRYAGLGRVESGGEAAIDAVREGARVQCLFHVAAAGTPLLEQAAAGGGMRLLTIGDASLGGASIGGTRVYVPAKIPVGTYPGFGSPGARDVHTVAVRAVLAVMSEWARRNGATHQALLAAVEDARAAIKRRISGR